ncbi:hypothetical protein MNB_SM-6-629 [hydrothermal vent metagenome]|uniref:Periplasmic protein n=1 Tax=hydrothermal vent metagenome TaxID=652676 RepID=A0A1W1CHH7_9ZZZZ
MAENTNRSVFGLHGLTGIAISIVGLLVILVTLMLLVIVAQRHAAENPYDPSVIRDINNLKMKSTKNFDYSFVDAKNKETK